MNRGTRSLGILLFTLIAGLAVVLCCARPALGQFPSGYYRDGRAVAKIQQRVFGFTYWSSIKLAQIEQESGWRRCPRSPAGARGLTQFIPSTQAAVERQIGVYGDICKPDHAALLQSHLMRQNALACGARFTGFHTVWSCTLRIYNGSPRNFWREWELAGRPNSTYAMEGTCVRRAAHCRENWQYPRRIFNRWPKYAERWGR